MESKKMIKTKRHIAKAISYRILGTIINVILAYILIGRLKFALSFGLFEIILKTIVYFLHERFWYKYIKYGVWHGQQQQK